MNGSKEDDLVKRLKAHPILTARFEALLKLAENTRGDVITANEAERQTIEGVRNLGHELLQDWAQQRVKASVKELKAREQNLKGHGKKKIAWHTTFGDVTVWEPVFIQPRKQFRPFSTSAGVSNRGCSLPLPRVIVDFGADHAFGRVSNKLHEHYGITIATSTIRYLTQHHGQQIFKQEKRSDTIPDRAGCAIQIAQLDGSMIPTVRIDENAKDRRKNKTLLWKEARLSLAHEQGSATPKFGAVFAGHVDEAGQCLLNSAIWAGFGKQTYLHVVGDGAPWIAEQVEDQFGSQGHYLLDFYHVCNYLAAASQASVKEGDAQNPLESWKHALKNHEYETVIDHLKPDLEANEVDDNHAPIRVCHRYLSNHSHQLDYKTAINQGLPIGSGEIESAHRYVIQERLKLSGAWWKANHVDSMLALRVLSANNEWNRYWEQLAQET